MLSNIFSKTLQTITEALKTVTEIVQGKKGGIALCLKLYPHLFATGAVRIVPRWAQVGIRPLFISGPLKRVCKTVVVGN